MTDNNELALGKPIQNQLAQAEAAQIESASTANDLITPARFDSAQSEAALSEAIPSELTQSEPAESQRAHVEPADSEDAETLTPAVDSAAPPTATPNATSKRPSPSAASLPIVQTLRNPLGPVLPKASAVLHSTPRATASSLRSSICPKRNSKRIPNSRQVMLPHLRLPVKPKPNSPAPAPISSSASIASPLPSTISSPSVTKNMAIAGTPVTRNRMPR
jgi:hypothetical protein